MGTLFHIIIGFLSARLGISVFNLISRPWLTSQPPLDETPLLSILIPARNEGRNLPRLLDQLLNLDYSDLEIIVLNDHSEDNTEEILQSYASQYPFITYLNGKPLPDDWFGKHWACHQLAEIAKGDYFLFMDADISEVRPGLIEHSLAITKRRGLALFSLFPDQIMETTGEKIVVPIMHYLLLSLLPLWAVYHVPIPSMAAANGQFMLFEAVQYRKHLWHRQARQIIVEDIAIMRAIKKNRLKGMTMLANGFISCRMYRGFWEGMQGFSKNILAGFGNSIVGILLYLWMIYFGWLLLLFYIPPNWLIGALGAMLGVRIAVSFAARQPIWINMILHPVQMLSLVGVSLLSIYKRLIGKNEWKGRNLQLRRQ